MIENEKYIIDIDDFIKAIINNPHDPKHNLDRYIRYIELNAFKGKFPKGLVKKEDVIAEIAGQGPPEAHYPHWYVHIIEHMEDWKI